MLHLGAVVTTANLTKLAEVFNVIECIGYLTTALKAHRVYKQLSAEQDMVEALVDDRRDCLSEQMQRLSIEAVGSPYFTRLTEPLRLPSVYGFLRKNQQEIDEIYHKPQQSFEWYEYDSRLGGTQRVSSEEPLRRKLQFDDARSAWLGFVNNSSRRP